MEGVERLRKKLLEALRAADCEEIVPLTDAHALLLVPDTPALRGKESISAWLHHQFRHKSRNAEIEIAAVQIEEALGIVEGRFTAMIEDLCCGEIEVLSGNFLAVIRRSGKEWLISRCSFCSDLPPARFSDHGR